MLRTVLFGTPEYAVPTLKLLAHHAQFDVVLVVSQPDRAAGRGQRLFSPPVKLAAGELGLPIYQPDSLRTHNARIPIEAVSADVFVVAAFGLIFGKATLAMPRVGCLNLHASLLPRFRGASPITAAILTGESHTGVSLMKMDAGLDTGPVVATASVRIEGEDTTESLTTRLAALAADLAVTAIPRFASGELTAHQQPRNGASLTRPLTKSDGWLDWTQSANVLERRIRAMWPWPRAWTTIRTEPVQVHKGRCVDSESSDQPGYARMTAGELVVGCGQGALALELVQPAGRRPMPGAALLAGRHFSLGERLGQYGAPHEDLPLVQYLD